LHSADVLVSREQIKERRHKKLRVDQKWDFFLEQRKETIVLRRFIIQRGHEHTRTGN